MIKLDRWESQFVWLSKGWLNSYFEENELEYAEDIDALKNLWGERCGMYAKHVDIVFIAKSLYETVVKCGCFNNRSAFTFIEDMAILDKYSRLEVYKDNTGYLKRVCWVALQKYLSTLQIFANGTHDTLIELQPFEPELFLT